MEVINHLWTPKTMKNEGFHSPPNMGHNFFHPSRDRFLQVGTPYLLSKLTQPLRGIRCPRTTSKFAQVAQLRTPEVGPLGRMVGPGYLIQK